MCLCLALISSTVPSSLVPPRYPPHTRWSAAMDSSAPLPCCAKPVQTAHAALWLQSPACSRSSYSTLTAECSACSPLAAAASWVRCSLWIQWSMGPFATLSTTRRQLVFADERRSEHHVRCLGHAIHLCAGPSSQRPVRGPGPCLHAGLAWRQTACVASATQHPS